jgi:hypothetical protein
MPQSAGAALDAAVAELPSEAHHGRGVLIVAPQAAGKTQYCVAHPHWCDADSVLIAAGLMVPKQTATPAELKAWERHTVALKAKGLWVLTSSWWLLADADAVVLPTRDELEARLRKKHRAPQAATWPHAEADTQLRLLREWAAKGGKPVYASVVEACYMVP